MATVRLGEQLTRLVDERRGDVPRDRFVRKTLESALGGRRLEKEEARALEAQGEAFLQATPVETPVVIQSRSVASGPVCPRCESTKVVDAPVGLHAGRRCLDCGRRWKVSDEGSAGEAV